MSDTPSPRPAASDARMRTSRLVAYYLLLFFFMFLMSQLLNELEARYEMHQLEKIDELIHEAFSFSRNFDNVVQALFSLILSFLFTLPVAWVYILTRDEDTYDPSLVHTIVVLSMAVAGVMIVIGNELARAFSLAGVVAAVRFRATLDDARDAVYLFIAIAVGMACGTRLYHIAVWLGLAMSAILLLLWKYRFGRRAQTSAAPVSALPSDGRKKKKKKPKWLPEEASPEARARIEQALEQQIRLAQWANLTSDKNKKKANAAILVESKDVGKAQEHVDAVLAAHGGRWRLANVTANGDGQGVLEYVGRLPKELTPATMVTALRQGSPEAVAAVEVRSLKGLKAPLTTPPSGVEPQD